MGYEADEALGPDLFQRHRFHRAEVPHPFWEAVIWKKNVLKSQGKSYILIRHNDEKRSREAFRDEASSKIAINLSSR